MWGKSDSVAILLFSHFSHQCSAFSVCESYKNTREMEAVVIKASCLWPHNTFVMIAVDFSYFLCHDPPLISQIPRVVNLPQIFLFWQPPNNKCWKSHLWQEFHSRQCKSSAYIPVLFVMFVCAGEIWKCWVTFIRAIYIFYILFVFKSRYEKTS